MNLKKIWLFSLTLYLIFTILIIVYSKNNFKSINYNSYINQNKYTTINSNKSNNNYGMSYEKDLKLDGFFIDDKINTFNDLKDLSDYILIVSNDKNPTFKGNGIINNCEIKKVIKGKNLKKGDEIKIYDLILDWNNLSSYYIGGNTPLLKGDEYIVFLKKTDHASENNTYVFNSVKYGRVSLLKNRKVLENYNQGSLPLKDIINYDMIYTKMEDEIYDYKKMVENIRNYADEKRLQE